MTTRLHPSLANAPKTPRESLTRMLGILKKAAANPRSQCLGAYNYECCLVGKFFTPEQLADLQSRNIGRMSVISLAFHLGKKNVMAMTGLDIERLRLIQVSFDREADRSARSTFGETRALIRSMLLHHPQPDVPLIRCGPSRKK